MQVSTRIFHEGRCMRPEAFALERYFDRYEFSTRYLLCSSDA